MGLVIKCFKNYPSNTNYNFIFNKMHKQNDYPNSWGESFIHFIDKQGKKGLRPLSLTSFMCKLFETLIKNRLQWYV